MAQQPGTTESTPGTPETPGTSQGSGQGSGVPEKTAQIAETPETPRHVLIVEDDRDMLDILQIYVQTLGMTTRIAQNGQEALEMIKANAPAAIILDLMLPVKSGISLLLELEREQANPNIPVIVYSAIGNYKNITDHLPGVVGVLPKGQSSLTDLRDMLIKAKVLDADQAK